MDIETSLMVTDYPEPPEQRTKTIEIKIAVDYVTEIEVPEEWDRERIKEDIRENFREYISEAEINDWEADMYG